MNEHLKHILGGAASLLALMPVASPPYVVPVTQGRSDLEALRGDMRMLGADMQKAMKNVAERSTATG